MAATPEPLYRGLTSGDTASLDSIRCSVADARTALAEAATATSSGALTAIQDWRGQSARAFAERARASCATASEEGRGLADVESALVQATALHTAMERSAEAIMKPWRNSPDLDEHVRKELAVRTIKATSQGLAHDGTNLLVTSYRDSDGEGDQDDLPEGQTPSRLTYVDHESGEEWANVYLDDMPHPGGPPDQLAAAGPPTHSGGIATDGENVWVSSNGHVYLYDKADLDRAAQQGDDAPPVKAKDVIPHSDPVGGIGPRPGRRSVRRRRWLRGQSDVFDHSSP